MISTLCTARTSARARPPGSPSRCPPRARLPGRGAEHVGHQRHDEGLGDGLAVADGQRPVLVGVGGQLGRHEGVPRHAAHRLEHARVDRGPAQGASARRACSSMVRTITSRAPACGSAAPARGRPRAGRGRRARPGVRRAGHPAQERRLPRAEPPIRDWLRTSACGAGCRRRGRGVNASTLDREARPAPSAQPHAPRRRPGLMLVSQMIGSHSAMSVCSNGGAIDAAQALRRKPLPPDRPCVAFCRRPRANSRDAVTTQQNHCFPRFGRRDRRGRVTAPQSAETR
jgi:hypothetical protein